MVFKFTLSKVYSELYCKGVRPIPNCQGKPVDLKAEIAGLHALLDPRLVALLAQIIPTFGKKGL